MPSLLCSPFYALPNVTPTHSSVLCYTAHALLLYAPLQTPSTAQIVDDLLDLTGSSSILGKPALNDMKSGVATAPVLFAAQQQPALCVLIKRKFKNYGDIDEVGDAC